MKWQQAFDRLYLDDQLIVDHKIHAIAAVEPNALIDNRKSDLSQIRELRLAKLPTKTFLIGRFQ